MIIPESLRPTIICLDPLRSLKIRIAANRFHGIGGKMSRVDLPKVGHLVLPYGHGQWLNIPLRHLIDELAFPSLNLWFYQESQRVPIGGSRGAHYPLT